MSDSQTHAIPLHSVTYEKPGEIHTNNSNHELSTFVIKMADIQQRVH